MQANTGKNGANYAKTGNIGKIFRDDTATKEYL